MKYYLMYESNSDYELTMVVLELLEEVTCFIEKKINEQGYSIEDFQLIQGTSVNMKVDRSPDKVLIT